MDISKTQLEENHVSKLQLHSTLPLTFYLTCSKFIPVMCLLQSTILQRKKGIGQGVVQCTKTVHLEKWGGKRAYNHKTNWKYKCWAVNVPTKPTHASTCHTPVKKTTTTFRHAAHSMLFSRLYSPTTRNKFPTYFRRRPASRIVIKKKAMLGVTHPKCPSLLTVKVASKARNPADTVNSLETCSLWFKIKSRGADK